MQEPFFHSTASGTVAASLHEIRRIGERPCSQCHRLDEEFFGPVEVSVTGRGEWPDILPMVYTTLFSDRVVDAIERLCAEYAADPVTVRRVSKTVGGTARPYYLLRVPGGVDIDLDASRCAGLTVCSCCGSILDGGLDCERLIPMGASWNGAPFFTLRVPRMRDYYICTREVLDIARTERWIGFHFTALDIPKELLIKSEYQCIDYLGEKWPPDSWYPEPSGENPTLEQ